MYAEFGILPFGDFQFPESVLRFDLVQMAGGHVRLVSPCGLSGGEKEVKYSGKWDRLVVLSASRVT